MPPIKKGPPRPSPFAQMLRAKREKLAPNATLREFCSARGLEAPLIDGMERDRRTAPGTYGALHKLASAYGHGPNDRWTVALLDAALGKAPVAPRAQKLARPGTSRGQLQGGKSSAKGATAARAPRAQSRVARGAARRG